MRTQTSTVSTCSESKDSQIYIYIYIYNLLENPFSVPSYKWSANVFGQSFIPNQSQSACLGALRPDPDSDILCFRCLSSRRSTQIRSRQSNTGVGLIRQTLKVPCGLRQVSSGEGHHYVHSIELHAVQGQCLLSRWCIVKVYCRVLSVARRKLRSGYRYSVNCQP